MVFFVRKQLSLALYFFYYSSFLSVYTRLTVNQLIDTERESVSSRKLWLNSMLPYRCYCQLIYILIKAFLAVKLISRRKQATIFKKKYCVLIGLKVYYKIIRQQWKLCR